MNLNGLVTGGVVLSLVGSAVAGPLVFQIDIVALSAASAGPFSDSYTGAFSVFNTPAEPDTDLDAEILDILVDGVAQSTGGALAADFFFDLNIVFSAGKIASGDLTVKIDETGSENTYTATLKPTVGVAIQDVGGLGTIFNIAGLTFDGMFSSPAGTFLGVGVSPWGSIQPVPGWFSEIAFQPVGAGHEDADTDVDVFVTIPLPTGAVLAGVGLSGVLIRRRR